MVYLLIEGGKKGEWRGGGWDDVKNAGNEQVNLEFEQ